MIKPTLNDISQKQHGQYKAVDFRAKDKSNNWRKEIYAPEDMTITFYGNNGTAGKQIQAQGAAGRHGFAHTEACLVPVNTKVKKGQLIGIMGWTGLVQPPNVNGSHLHWTIRRSNGTYVYPMDLVNEDINKFIKGDNMRNPSRDEVNAMYIACCNRSASEAEIKNYTQHPFDTCFLELYNSQESINWRKRANDSLKDSPTVIVNDVRYAPTK